MEGDWTEDKLNDWIKNVVNKVNQLLLIADEVHFYITNPYWDLIKKVDDIINNLK